MKSERTLFELLKLSETVSFEKVRSLGWNNVELLSEAERIRRVELISLDSEVWIATIGVNVLRTEKLGEASSLRACERRLCRVSRKITAPE